MEKKPWKDLIKGNLSARLVLGWLLIVALIAVGAAVSWQQFF